MNGDSIMRIFAVLLFLTACAASTTTDYQTGLQKWVGQSDQQLYQAWGQPNNVFPVTDETSVVTFITTDKGPVDGNTTPYAGVEVDYPAITSTNYGSNLSNNDDSFYYCKTSFTITNGEVIDYTFNGDDCVGTKSIW